MQTDEHKPRKLWTPAHDTVLRYLVWQPFTIAQIAKRLGFTVGPVYKSRRLMAGRSYKPRIRPKHHNRTPKTIARKCLECGAAFMTDSPYIRLCEKHRGGE